VVNVTSPEPVRNAELTRVLGRVLKRPALVAVPGFAVRLLYGEMGEETVLAGQRVLPRRLGDAGFQFQFPLLEPALRHELSAG
jgi:NAD dependent epimerase/dehydratase family enzyme